MTEHSGIPLSLRKRVFKLLDKDPLLKPMQICNLIEGITYEQNGEVVTQYKKQWKKEYKSQRGLIRSCPDDVHNVFYKGVLPPNVVRDARSKPLPFGWRLSRSKNKFWLFKSTLGRVRFFETGTVEIFVRKPANLGKCMQLFCDAFTKNYLITDIRVVDQFKAGLMIRFHATYKTGQRLPYMKITTFEDTHRLIFVSGDSTHPDCYEIIKEYSAEVEQARRLFEELRLGLLGGNGDARSKPLGRDYSI